MVYLIPHYTGFLLFVTLITWNVISLNFNNHVIIKIYFQKVSTDKQTLHSCFSEPHTLTLCRNLKFFLNLLSLLYEHFLCTAWQYRKHSDCYKTYSSTCLNIRGTAVAQWLRCCATNRKVSGSIPPGVSGFLIDIKSFRSHSMVLGSTQPLTEISTRSISWG